MVYLYGGSFIEMVYKFYLMYISSFLYIAIFCYTAFVFWKSKEIFKKVFSPLDRRWLWVLCAILVIALYARLPALDSDEVFSASTWEYVIGAKNLAVNGVIQRCDYGSFNDCWQPASVAHPAGFSVILAPIFFLFGTDPTLMLYLQFILSTATIASTFFLVYAITKSEVGASISAGFLALLPMHIIMTLTADGAMVITSLFFESLYFLFLFLAIQKRTKSLYRLTAMGFIVLLAFKMENLVYLPVSLVAYFGFRGFNMNTAKDLVKDLKDNMLTVLLALAIALVPLSVFLEHWILDGLAQSLFGLSFFLKNIDRLYRIFWPGFFPALTLLLFYVPFLLWHKKQRDPTLALLFWFVASPLMFMFFFIGPSPRYIMSVCLPFAALLGVGSFMLAKKRNARYLVVLMPLFMLLTYNSISEYNSDEGMNDLLTTLETVPKGSLLLVPSANTVWAIQSCNSDIQMAAFIRINRIETDDDLYMIETESCRHWFFTAYKDFCDYLVSIGTKVTENESNALYYIGNLNQEEMDSLLEIYSRHEREL